MELLEYTINGQPSSSITTTTTTVADSSTGTASSSMPPVTKECPQNDSKGDMQIEESCTSVEAGTEMKEVSASVADPAAVLSSSEAVGMQHSELMEVQSEPPAAVEVVETAIVSDPTEAEPMMMSEAEARLWRRRFVSAARYILLPSFSLLCLCCSLMFLML